MIDAGAAKLILDAPAHSLGTEALVFADGREIGFGTLGHDTLTASGRGAVLRGSAENDRLQGSGRADRLRSNDGADHLFGRGGGDDILRAGNGADRLIGGAGADVFGFGARLDNGVSEADVIGDFDPTEDMLHVPAGITAMTETEATLTLTLAGADCDTVLLADVTLAMLDPDMLPLLCPPYSKTGQQNDERRIAGSRHRCRISNRLGPNRVGLGAGGGWRARSRLCGRPVGVSECGAPKAAVERRSLRRRPDRRRDRRACGTSRGRPRGGFGRRRHNLLTCGMPQPEGRFSRVAPTPPSDRPELRRATLAPDRRLPLW